VTSTASAIAPEAGRATAGRAAAAGTTAARLATSVATSTMGARDRCDRTDDNWILSMGEA